MFIALLGLTLLVSLLVCAASVALFWKPLKTMLASRLSEGAAALWARGIALVVFVIGTSVGVRVWDLERHAGTGRAVSTDVMALEVYKSAILTAQASVAVLAVIFVAIGVFALMKRRES